MNGGVEERVARHYARDGLEKAILDAVAATGASIDRLTAADLAPGDEFHIGGREATAELAAQMDIVPGTHLLDIGCGIGGPARFFAQTFGCRVTGIDLTPDFVRAAESLTRRVGLDDRISYRQATALALPFPPPIFDGAYMMHVGMNVPDKARLFREVRRVIKPGGVFAIYDVMRTGDGALVFPLPCAAGADTSFIARPDEYRRALQEAGFEIHKERNRHDYAVAFFRQAQARVAESGGPPPLRPHLLMGPDAPQVIANVVRNLEEGLIAPIEIIGRARPHEGRPL
jgi:SAM-dependent methyltransferase